MLEGAKFTGGITMKKLMTLSLLVLSLSAVADTIEHKNCELFLNTKSSHDFFRAVNMNPFDFAFALKAKGYQAITYYSQETLDRHTPMSGEQTEDLMGGELFLQVINPKSIKTRVMLVNNKKRDDGTVYNSEFIRTETIVSYKRLFQNTQKFHTEAGLELVKEIPDCVIKP